MSDPQRQQLYCTARNFDVMENLLFYSGIWGYELGTKQGVHTIYCHVRSTVLVSVFSEHY
jgi:hypothetical protein